jgi:hypothetical protein
MPMEFLVGTGGRTVDDYGMAFVSFDEGIEATATDSLTARRRARRRFVSGIHHHRATFTRGRAILPPW